MAEDAHKHEMMSYADECWRCLVVVAGCWLPVAGLTDFDFNLQWPRPEPWNAKAKAKWTNKATRQQTSFNGHIEVVVGATRLATLPVKWFMPMALPGTQQSPSPSQSQSPDPNANPVPCSSQLIFLCLVQKNWLAFVVVARIAACSISRCLPSVLAGPVCGLACASTDLWWMSASASASAFSALSAKYHALCLTLSELCAVCRCNLRNHRRLRLLCPLSRISCAAISLGLGWARAQPPSLLNDCTGMPPVGCAGYALKKQFNLPLP